MLFHLQHDPAEPGDIPFLAIHAVEHPVAIRTDGDEILQSCFHFILQVFQRREVMGLCESFTQFTIQRGKRLIAHLASIAVPLLAPLGEEAASFPPQV